MLVQLLRLVGGEGVYRVPELAGRLGVGEELLQQMLADLTRMGYLAPVAGGCGEGCGGCGPRVGCAPEAWVLTERAAALISR